MESSTLNQKGPQGFNPSLDERVYVPRGWGRQKIVIALKNYGGLVSIDVRKWFSIKDGSDVPSRKGIMLSVADWEVVMKDISELIKSGS